MCMITLARASLCSDSERAIAPIVCPAASTHAGA